MAQVFSDLDESLGEEENNNFWIGRVDEPTVEKLVCRVEAPARDVVRFMRALLEDAESPFVGAKLLRRHPRRSLHRVRATGRGGHRTLTMRPVRGLWVLALFAVSPQH